MIRENPPQYEVGFLDSKRSIGMEIQAQIRNKLDLEMRTKWESYSRVVTWLRK